ncbi:MAG: hypothetical protein PHC28_01875 [Flavobacterium sp.]|uniref:hypothetical protein n=1 Tax=Flavobacterium sp. TaxID=239 RepID=UPI002626E3FC|nr:hypothetical protein [Flavobacterium sp.]MDD5149216.1 hypothetical protein [Flavobacterium sp.]
MKKIILILTFTLFLNLLYAQDKKANNPDASLKETIYNENKKKVANYSLKEFDALFFEFFEKKSNPDILLTKEEFYNYTIKIGIFSDRLATLYPKEKETATKNKEMWFAENYEDYLLTKESSKK